MHSISKGRQQRLGCLHRARPETKVRSPLLSHFCCLPLCCSSVLLLLVLRVVFKNTSCVEPPRAAACLLYSQRRTNVFCGMMGPGLSRFGMALRGAGLREGTAVLHFSYPSSPSLCSPSLKARLGRILILHCCAFTDRMTRGLNPNVNQYQVH